MTIIRTGILKAYVVRTSKPKKRPEQTPLRWIKLLLPARTESERGPDTNDGVSDEQKRQGVARIFQPLETGRVANENSNASDEHPEVPNFCRNQQDERRSQPGAAEPAEKPEHHPEGSGNSKPVNQRIQLHGTDSAVGQPGTTGKKSTGMEFDGYEQPEDDTDQEPERSAEKENEDGESARSINFFARKNLRGCSSRRRAAALFLSR